MYDIRSKEVRLGPVKGDVKAMIEEKSQSLTVLSICYYTLTSLTALISPQLSRPSKLATLLAMALIIGYEKYESDNSRALLPLDYLLPHFSVYQRSYFLRLLAGFVVLATQLRAPPASQPRWDIRQLGACPEADGN